MDLPTLQESETVQDPNDKQTCFQFVDHLIQYVRDYRYSSHPPRVRLDGSQSFSLFGRLFVKFLTAERHFAIVRKVSDAVARCQNMTRDELPTPVLRFLIRQRPLLQHGTDLHCYLFLENLCRLCLELEDQGFPHFAETVMEFGKFLIGRQPNSFRHFLWMRNQA